MDVHVRSFRHLDVRAVLSLNTAISNDHEYYLVREPTRLSLTIRQVPTRIKTFPIDRDADPWTCAFVATDDERVSEAGIGSSSSITSASTGTVGAGGLVRR